MVSRVAAAQPVCGACLDYMRGRCQSVQLKGFEFHPSAWNQALLVIHAYPEMKQVTLFCFVLNSERCWFGRWWEWGGSFPAMPSALVEKVSAHFTPSRIWPLEWESTAGKVPEPTGPGSVCTVESPVQMWLTPVPDSTHT